MARRSKSKRSLAALKGWKTRRANLRLRSKAALKGWETRRKNARRIKARKKQLKKPPKKTEYQINVVYEPAEGAKVEVQISAQGPSGKTREFVLQKVEYKIRLSMEDLEDEESDPLGWELHIVFWEKKGKQFFGDDAAAWRQLNFLFHEGEKEVRNKKGKAIK